MKQIVLLFSIFGVAISALGCYEENFDPASLKPETLREIIAEQQKENVRESYGKLAHECFTDLDLADFIREKRAAKIAQKLKASKRFLAVVELIKQMPTDERKRFLASCRKPLRKTWAENGRIGDGQTEAGNRAELLIANQIVDVVEKLVETAAGQKRLMKIRQ